MKKIELTAHFGYEAKQVELAAPFGAGQEIWHVYINQYFQGMLIRIADGWRNCLTEHSGLTQDDARALFEIIDSCQNLHK